MKFILNQLSASGSIEITDHEVMMANSDVFMFTFGYEHKEGEEKFKNTRNGVIGEIIVSEYIKEKFKDKITISEDHTEGITENGFNYGDIKIKIKDDKTKEEKERKLLISTKVFGFDYENRLRKTPEIFSAFIKSSQIELYKDPSNTLVMVFLLDKGNGIYKFEIIGYLNGSDICELINNGRIEKLKKGQKYEKVNMCYDNYLISIKDLKKEVAML